MLDAPVLGNGEEYTQPGGNTRVKEIRKVWGVNFGGRIEQGKVG